jgi:mono/diheme cytochrome c family protein
VKGEQYVAVLSGFGSVFVLISGASVQAAPVNGRVYAYKIGASAAHPAIDRRTAPMPEPPAIAASPEDLARGSALYSELCSVCHGGGAAGGVIGDLRRSTRLKDRAAWTGVVVEGGLRTMGMPGFKAHLSEADADLIRAYVARQAAAAYGTQRKD